MHFKNEKHKYKKNTHLACFTMATRKPQEGTGVNTIKSEDCNSVQWTHDPEFGPTEERVSWL